MLPQGENSGDFKELDLVHSHSLPNTQVFIDYTTTTTSSRYLGTYTQISCSLCLMFIVSTMKYIIIGTYSYIDPQLEQGPKSSGAGSKRITLPGATPPWVTLSQTRGLLAGNFLFQKRC